MNDMLANPAVQAGVAPFIAALAVAFPLRNTRWLAWALGAAFLVVVALTMGFALEPMTSSRKLVFASLAGLVVLPFLEPRLPARVGVRLGVLFMVALVVSGWVLSRLLLQKETMPALVAALGCALFLSVLLEGTHRSAQRAPLHAAAVALVLGLGTGVLAVLGASAQLAQIAIAIGAGAGAAALSLLWARQTRGQGGGLGLLAALVTGQAALLSVFTGALAWYCLLPLAATPWVAWLVPVRDTQPRWLTAFFAVCAAAVPMLLAVVLAWSAAGSASAQAALPSLVS